jgi:hypothetical protein
MEENIAFNQKKMPIHFECISACFADQVLTPMQLSRTSVKGLEILWLYTDQGISLPGRTSSRSDSHVHGIFESFVRPTDRMHLKYIHRHYRGIRNYILTDCLE